MKRVMSLILIMILLISNVIAAYAISDKIDDKSIIISTNDRTLINKVENILLESEKKDYSNVNNDIFINIIRESKKIEKLLPKNASFIEAFITEEVIHVEYKLDEKIIRLAYLKQNKTIIKRISIHFEDGNYITDINTNNEKIEHHDSRGTINIYTKSLERWIANLFARFLNFFITFIYYAIFNVFPVIL